MLSQLKPNICGTGIILGRKCKDSEAILMTSRRTMRKLLLKAGEIRIMVCIDQILARFLPVLMWKIENIHSDLMDLAQKIPG